MRPAAHHRLWLELLCEPAIDSLLVVAPPESAKTSWTVLAYVGAYIGIFPERSVILASVTDSVAERRSLSLRTMVETDAWQRVFPGVRRAAGTKWDTMAWSLAMDGRPEPGRLHPTLFATGTGSSSVAGGRADLVLVDDICDLENTRTAHQREQVWQWLHSTLLPRRKSDPRGRTIVIGTSWHPDDAIARLRKSDEFVVCHMPLLSEGSEVYATLRYPEGWSGPTLGQTLAESVAGGVDGDLQGL